MLGTGPVLLHQNHGGGARFIEGVRDLRTARKNIVKKKS